MITEFNNCFISQSPSFFGQKVWSEKLEFRGSQLCNQICHLNLLIKIDVCKRIIFLNKIKETFGDIYNNFNIGPKA